MKRFLTGLLAAVAVLALAVPVSAADNTTTYIDVLRNKLVLGPQATTPSVATGGRIGVNQFGRVLERPRGVPEDPRVMGLADEEDRGGEGREDARR